MNLEPKAAEPGLLVNPAWKPGTPGTFAVIIGVSRYAHLSGGTDPAPESYQLGQLAVSGLTAFQWFRWLTSAYTFGDAPVAKCWLLLSPTREEIASEPELAHHTAEPTFDNCRKALGYWWQTMSGLSVAAAARSRAFFFFSGHGIEILQDRQILLPSDYLSPPARSWSDAISTDNLRQALASLHVPTQFFFLDACRNGSPELRGKLASGAAILNVDPASAVNPDLVAPLLFATSAGQRAFQQRDPQSGPSLFGCALLDGLQGKPDIALVRRDADYAVNLYALQSFIKQRLAELLAKSGDKVIQPVKLGGVVDDATITYLKPYTVRATRQGFAAGVFGREFGAQDPEEAPTGQARAAAIERIAENALPVTVNVTEPINLAYRNGDFNAGHDIFGSERVTALWLPSQVSVFGRSNGFPLGPGPFHILSAARDEDKSSYRLELEFQIPDPVGYRFEIANGASTLACVLPTLQGGRPRYALEFDVSFDSGQGHLTRLEAGLALSNSESLGEAARLWQRYSIGDLGEAIRLYEQDSEQLREMVRNKVESPVSALVAAIVLVRANRGDLIRDWLPNLAERFPELPDGRILWAKYLFRQGDPQGAAEALAPLRKLPFTNEAFSYAASLPLQFPFKPRIEEALAGLQPGGLFAVFEGAARHA